MFRKNYTAWIPLGFYSHGSDDYLTMVRKNTKTGMLHFKTKQVTGRYANRFIPIGLLNVTDQWNKIINPIPTT